jgi:hypothetical protein
MRSLRSTVHLLVAEAVACTLACSGTSPEAPQEAPVYAVCDPLPSARLSPYPSDRYAREDATSPTGLRPSLGPSTNADPFVASYPKTAADLEAMDGFSTIGGVVLSFTADVDPASFTRPVDAYRGADAPAALVDVDDRSPDRGTVVGLLPLYASTSDGLYDYVREDHTLLFQPARPLRPRTRYLFVATDAIKTRGGKPVRASQTTLEMLAGTASGTYAERVRAALPVLEKATGLRRASIVAATHFTTAAVHDELLAAARARRAAPPPKLAAPFALVESSKDGRARFAGAFEAPEYRTPKPDGRFAIAAGAPTIQATVALQTSLAFSDATKSGPRPIVIYGHGLGGDQGGVWGTAERMRALDPRGVAVFGLDAPEHGSRAATKSDNKLAPVFAFFGIDAQTKDESFVIARARDNFRQMALDQLELVRLLEAARTLDLLPAGAPDGVPDLDPDRILYIGHSFGSVMGPTVAALAPEIRAATWNVGGAGLTTLLRDSATFKFIIEAMRPPGTPQGDLMRFFAITQAIVDPGDAANYARGVTLEALPGVPGWKPRDVLLQEVHEDSIVPNSTSALLARAAGLVHQGPKRHDVPGLAHATGPQTANLSSGATGVFAQFERDAKGQVIDHGSLIFTPEAQAQYVAFFQSALAGRAVVPPP